MRTPVGFFLGGLVVKYAKPPLSFEEQIALLESRGMEIPDHARASRYLSHINYYRLRAYWLPFETGADAVGHCFQPGTTFDSALILYVFDRKFRLLVLEAIERVEVSFRTHFAYELATKYGSHAFMEPGIFHNPRFHQQLLDSLKEEIARSQEIFIDHYRTTYDEPVLPPLWAVCEVMSFGQLSKWFQNLKHRHDRKAIADAYGIDEKVLGSFMHHLTHIRNLTAHHCRLWNRKLTVTMTIPKYPEKLRTTFNSAAERRIYNTLAMLGYLMRLISPGTSWPGRIRQLLEDCAGINTAVMGFPENWRDLPLWRENP
jgi:abortive infection bacteriophage resistance protein